jgi:hypothetical protein
VGSGEQSFSEGAMSEKTLSEKVRIFLLAVLCLAATGCFHAGANPNYRGPRPLPERIRKDFSHPRYEGPADEKFLREASRYTVRRIAFPSTHNILSYPHEILIDYYDVHPRRKRPVILVLPVMAGPNEVAREFADYFARHGYAAIVVHRQAKFRFLKNIEVLNEILRQIVLDQMQALDWVTTRSELDASRIGVFGVSMGGVKAALLAALDKRIGAAVIALASGDIPYVLTHSTDKELVRKREQIMRERNLTLVALQNRLRKEITCDPMNLAKYMDARKILLVLACFDKTLPYAKGLELRKKIGDPETIYLLSGHYTSVIFEPYIEFESLEFFNHHLQKR